MSDPEILRASERYVSVIVRRPHAYQFLVERFAGESPTEDEVSGSEAGMLIRRQELPIPGLYVLDADGEVLGQAGLLQEGARDGVLELLADPARRR